MIEQWWRNGGEMVEKWCSTKWPNNGAEMVLRRSRNGGEMVEKWQSNCRGMFEKLQETVGKLARIGRDISR